MTPNEVLKVNKFGDKGISYELRMQVNIETTLNEHTWLEFSFVSRYPLKERLIMCVYHQITEFDEKTYTYNEDEAIELFAKLEDQIGESYYD